MLASQKQQNNTSGKIGYIKKEKGNIFFGRQASALQKKKALSPVCMGSTSQKKNWEGIWEAEGVKHNVR